MRIGSKVLGGLVIFSILITSAIVLLAPADVQAAFCPQGSRSGDPSTSEVAPNPGALPEQDQLSSDDCEGFFGGIKCFFAGLFANFSTTGEERGKLTLENSTMPTYLRTANSMALSYSSRLAELFYGDPEATGPKALTGTIAKMLIPGYTDDGIDPKAGLIAAEAQLVEGAIILNQNAPQTGFQGYTIKEEPRADAPPGFYDLQEDGSPNYQVVGRFGEVAPLYDRYGFIKQALMPSAGSVTIPDPESNDCPISKYEPDPIDITYLAGANRDRDVFWKAYGELTDADTAEASCDIDPQTGEEICPSSAEGTFNTGGNLDAQSRVSLAGDAWERLGAPSEDAGEGGVFNILLPPDTSFRTDPAKEPRLPYTYEPHSRDSEGLKRSSLYIAELGNVKGAVSCVVNALTEHPARANNQACNQALETPFGPVTCIDEATPLEFPNTAGSGIARRAWEIVNRLYQGFWCLWNWSKDDYPEIFDENEYRRNPNPPYPPDHYIAMFWCTELVRHSYNNLSLSLVSEDMARQFGAQGPQGGPYQSGGRFTSISDATWQNIRPGYVIFFIVPGPTSYRLNHVGIVYSVSRDGMTIVQSNAGTKSLLVPVLDNGRISGTVGNFRVMGFGRP